MAESDAAVSRLMKEAGVTAQDLKAASAATRGGNTMIVTRPKTNSKRLVNMQQTNDAARKGKLDPVLAGIRKSAGRYSSPAGQK